MHAQIQARKVAFGAARPLDSATETIVRGGETVERDEYSFHDGRLIRVLFVEAACDSLAPAAGAFVRKYTAHVLGVSIASASMELTAPTCELQDITVKAVEELSAKMPTARISLGLLLEHGGAQLQYVISLDAASQTALKGLTAAQLANLGNPKLIHQGFDRPTTANAAEETVKKLQAFAQELPDLLSFYA